MAEVETQLKKAASSKAVVVLRGLPRPRSCRDPPSTVVLKEDKHGQVLMIQYLVKEGNLYYFIRTTHSNLDIFDDIMSIR